MRLDVGRVDHLRLTRSSTRRKFAEKPFPAGTFSPADKTIIDGCRRSILGRTVAPPAAALEDMKNAADDAPVIDPLLAAHVPWQMRFDPAPLLITKPKQIAAHLPAPKSPVAGNQQSILTSTLLLGSRPSRPASPDTPRRPDRRSLQAEASTCRDPGCLDCPGFIFVAVKSRTDIYRKSCY